MRVRLAWQRRLRSGFLALLVAAMATAGGFLTGDAVVGPLLSVGHPDRPHRQLWTAERERAWIDKMSARPDPSPYGTPTPSFDAGDVPDYAALAKAKAKRQIASRNAKRRIAREIQPEKQQPFAGQWREYAPPEYRPPEFPHFAFGEAPRDRHIRGIY